MTSEQMLNKFDTFVRMPIIDAHLHVWHGFQARQVWDTLAVAGVQRCNALSLNNFEKGGTLNVEALDFKRTAKGLSYAFGSLDYSSHLQGGRMQPKDLVQQAAHLHELGFDGIKMWEGKPLAYIVLPDRLDSSFFDPFFGWMEAHGLPIILHLADAPRFWDPKRKGLDPWSYADARYPSRKEMYAEMERIMERHPRLNLILAHFLFLWDELGEARRILNDHPSIAFDLTPGVQGYIHLSQQRDAARQFFLDYQDRLIYGTDIGALPLLDESVDFDVDREAAQPWLVRAFLETDWDMPFPQRVGIIQAGFGDDRLRGITLPPPVLEKIYRLNFERLAGAAPLVI